MNSRVMPTFLAITPERNINLPSSNRNLHVHAGGEVELHERVHRLRRRIDNVEKTLMRPDLELIAGFLVYVGSAKDREFLDLVRQRNRSADLGTRPFGGVHDFLRAGIQNAVIECLQPNANVLTL